MRVDGKPVDDGYRSMCTMLTYEIHVFELRIERNVHNRRTFTVRIIAICFNGQLIQMHVFQCINVIYI